jgi:hypothetical protein
MADDLVAFLHARLDEDEQAARAAAGAPWTADDVPGCIHVEAWARAEQRALRGLGFVGSVEREPDRQHIARYDPARVLREVEAKRQILNLHRRDSDYGSDPICNVCLYTPPCETVRVLALPYSDHPDYHEEWRP